MANRNSCSLISSNMRTWTSAASRTHIRRLTPSSKNPFDSVGFFSEIRRTKLSVKQLIQTFHPVTDQFDHRTHSIKATGTSARLTEVELLKSDSDWTAVCPINHLDNGPPFIKLASVLCSVSVRPCSLVPVRQVKCDGGCNCTSHDALWVLRFGSEDVRPEHCG